MAAFKVGEINVDRHQKVPPYIDVKRYIIRVHSALKAYQNGEIPKYYELYNDSQLAASSGKFDEQILFYSQTFDVEPALVKAVIHAESSFDPQAVSRAGAMGLMQLMPNTARQYASGNLHSPEHNISVGTQHLRHLISRYTDNLDLVLAAYNAGEGAVSRYSGVPPFRETTTYIKRVKSLLQKYRNIERRSG